MLSDRLFGAFSFRQGIYSEVEHDESFTQTAWILVAVAGFLSQLGLYANANLARWLISAVGGTIAILIGFALGVWVITWVGKNFFNAEVTFDEMVRTLGLASVWFSLSTLASIVAFVPVLRCILTPVILLVSILGLIAWFVAAKEALDLEILQTIITVVIGFVGMAIIVSLARFLLGFFGIF